MENNTDTVSVYCRLKPLFNENFIPCIKYENQFTVSTFPPEGCRRNTKEMKYTFTKVFNDCSQTEIFNDVACPVVMDLLNKKNGLLFAYGVTGSGKTHTMEGNKENPGIVARTIKALFRRLNFIKRFRIRPDERNWYKVYHQLDALGNIGLERNYYSRKSGDYECKSYMENVEEDPFEIAKVNNCTVFISMVEIYGNNLKDLLIRKNDKKCEVTIKEDPTRKHKYLHNVREIEVQTATEALYWFLRGQKKRKTSSTNLNDQSSRSHCVFNIRLVQLDESKGGDYSSSTGEGLYVNELSLVDLAGSERAKRTGALGAQLKEAGDINNSLMDLQIIMKCLREKQKSKSVKHINYRANTLTRFFKTNFENDCNVRMIICVQQNPEEYDETLNVLAFAEDAREVRIVKNTPRIQKVPLKVCNTNKEVENDFDEFDKLGVELDELNLVKSYINVSLNEIENEGEMMRTIFTLFTYISKINEVKDKTKKAYLELHNHDDSDEDDMIADELNMVKLEKIATQKKFEESEKSNLEKDKKITELLLLVNQREIDNKNLNEQIRKNDELESRLKGEKLNEIMEKANRKSIRANPERTVQVIKQKFENVQNISSKPVLKTRFNKPVYQTPNGRPYYNPCYKTNNKENNYILHKEKNNVPIGSLHQLNLKNKLVSSDIKMKDLGKSNKYLLERQSGSKDQFITDYIEGNVTPTAGGGFAVQLTGVETVKQSNFRNSKGRKRHSSLSSDISDKKYKLDFN